jgi:hypothetical protein
MKQNSLPYRLGFRIGIAAGFFVWFLKSPRTVWRHVSNGDRFMYSVG